MARTPLEGSSPLQITTDTGDLISIPLSLLFLDDQGQAHVSGTTYAAHEGAAVDRLKALMGQGLVAVAIAPPPQPAVVLTATQPGANGNDIRVRFASSKPQDLKKPTFDATLTHTASYAGLTKITIKVALGSSKETGTGPAFLTSIGPGLPAAGTYAAANGVVVVPDATDPKVDALTVTFRTVDAAATCTVVIDQVGAAAGFTLTATWTKTLSGLTAADLKTKNKFFSQVAVAAPAGASDPGFPADGTVILSGGADARDPMVAATTVLGP